MKRNVAIIFLIIANLTLLVHATIPHHNHNGDFCVISTETENDCEDDCHHENETTTHQQPKHDCEDSNQDCDLEVKVIIPNKLNAKQDVIVIDLIFSSLQSLDLFSKLESNSLALQSFKELLTIIPIKHSLYQCYITYSSGYRGPPYFV